MAFERRYPEKKTIHAQRGRTIAEYLSVFMPSCFYGDGRRLPAVPSDIYFCLPRSIKDAMMYSTIDPAAKPAKITKDMIWSMVYRPATT